MPVIKSAKKKLQQDKKRTTRNAKQETALKDAIKAAKKSPSVKTVSVATSLADKAAKRHIVHKNKASRIKSALSKLIGGEKPAKTEAKVTAKSPKGTSYTVAASEKKAAKPAKKAAPKKK